MDSEEPQQPAFGESAGQQLKQAREKLGLSMKDVADAQHLRVSIIQSIEDARYDQIDSELFLKGYIRTYAKQVGADADALIETLDVELEPLRREREKREQENPLIDIERRRRKKRRVAKALGLIIVAVIIGVGAWKLAMELRPSDSADPALNDEAASSAEPVTAAADSAETESTPEPEVPVELADNSDPASNPEPIADLSAPEDSGERNNDPEPASPVISPEPETTPEPATAQTSTEDRVPEQDTSIDGGSGQPTAERPVEQIVEPVAQPDPVFAESAQPEAVAPATELEMSFVDNCWVQVTDSSGARLVASLQRAGDQISVSGRAPFNVVIGAVDAVDSVSFGGESVDLSSFRVVNNRTEFTLSL